MDAIRWEGNTLYLLDQTKLPVTEEWIPYTDYRPVADAIRTNKVTVNGAYAKPSREVKIGDLIAVRKQQVTYSYKVLDLVSSRQPAKNVPLYCLDVTPQEERDKLNIPRETVFVFRERGTGRPTKKERRELDTLMDEIYYDDEE